MDEYKDEFMKGGEIIYAGALDTVIAQSGYYRINLKMVLGKDQQVVLVKAYWNEGLDSITIPIQRPLSSDTVNLLIPDLSARSYSFSVYTFDQQGHSSVVRNASGVSYGDDYLNSLANRTIRTSAANTGVDSMIFRWNEPNNGLVFTELEYTRRDGTVRQFTMLNTDSIMALPDEYASGTELRYRSAYKPDANAYDTFRVTEYATVAMAAVPPYERSLDKTKFARVVLPTDVGASSYATWPMTNMWNGYISGNGYATAISTNPCWFTFDMGEAVTLNRFMFWQPQDRIYRLEAVKRFEIYGSETLDMTGSWDSWTLLRTCESYKPSGSPVGTNTAEDIAFALAGEAFTIPDGMPKVRYIRIKVLENWGNSTFQAIGELTFFTRDRIK